jgi:PIN domain nuclease of toxin-antitoxin system
MKLLIDTHVLIWWLGARERIPANVQAALIDVTNEVLVSAVSAWEIAVKRRLGKLDFDSRFIADFDARIAALGFAPLAISAAHAITGAEIEATQKDPFDRMLAGQVRVEGLTLVTADRAFDGLGVTVMWGK